LGPEELVDELQRRLELLAERHGDGAPAARTEEPPAARGRASRARASRKVAAPEEDDAPARGETAIRPERFARLVTLATILIEAGRAGERLAIEELCERLQLTPEELREDVNVLNVVNFGGG